MALKNFGVAIWRSDVVHAIFVALETDDAFVRASALNFVKDKVDKMAVEHDAAIEKLRSYEDKKAIDQPVAKLGEEHVENLAAAVAEALKNLS